MSVARTERRNGLFTYLGIGRDHWRKGYGSEAVVLLLSFYFGELSHRKVEMKVYAFNEPSLRFHYALGFKRGGRRRSAHFTQGQYHDIILFGMMAEEFCVSLASGNLRRKSPEIEEGVCCHVHRQVR